MEKTWIDGGGQHKSNEKTLMGLFSIGETYALDEEAADCGAKKKYSNIFLNVIQEITCRLSTFDSCFNHCKSLFYNRIMHY